MKGPILLSISILHTSYVTGRIVFNTIKRKFLSALPSCLKWNSQSGLNLNFVHVYVAHQVSYAAPSEHKEASVPLFWPSICLIYHHSPIIPHRSAFCSNQWKDLACDWQLWEGPFKVREASAWAEKMRKVWKICLYSLFTETFVFRGQMWAN